MTITEIREQLETIGTQLGYLIEEAEKLDEFNGMSAAISMNAGTDGYVRINLDKRDDTGFEEIISCHKTNFFPDEWVDESLVKGAWASK